jgi:Aspartyl protease/PDZ domain
MTPFCKACAALVVAACVMLASGCGAFLVLSPRQSDIPEGGAILPTRRCDDAFLVQATINGTGPFLLLLDTGAATTVVTPAVARALPGSVGHTLQFAEGATGKTQTIHQRVRIDTLEAGEMRLKEFDALVIDLQGLDTSVGGTLDGVLGYPAFHDLLLTIDYPRGVVRVSREQLSEPDSRTLRLSSRREPIVPVRLGDKAIEAELDSGSGGELTLQSKVKLEYVTPPRAAGSSLALGGAEVRRVGRAAVDAELAGVQIDHPLIESGAVINLVGTEILRHFVVRFDQRSGLVRLEHMGEGPIEFPSVYGIGIASSPENGVTKVIEVFDESPAQRAGVQVGDLIQAINGVAVLDLICDRAMRRLYSREGPMRLSVQRGEEHLEILCAAEVMVP